MISVKGEAKNGATSEEKKIQGNALGAAEMNAFIDSYFVDPSIPCSSSSSSDHTVTAYQSLSQAAAAKKADDDDLEVLLKETDGMRDLVQLEQVEGLIGVYREEKSKQRRAAAARSRYQKMSENERKIYNNKRRLRQMGIDPDGVMADGTPIRVQLKQANAKKAEAARQRYHRMTPEQKRDYNRRRTEAFRKRRQEEEELLSTPAGQINSKALEKAQQIMIRNARKAESARLRYQRMTPEERKNYNMKRASAKKTKKYERVDIDGNEEEGDDDGMEMCSSAGDPSAQLIQRLQQVNGQQGDDLLIGDALGQPQAIYAQDTPHMHRSHPINDPPPPIHHGPPEDSILHIINEVAHPAELDIFTQMEKEVLKRTQIAQRTIQKQYDNLTSLLGGDTLDQEVLAHALGTNAIVGGIQYDVAPISAPATARNQMPMTPEELGMTRSAGLRAPKTDNPIRVQKSVPSILEDPAAGGAAAGTSEKGGGGSGQTHVIDEKMLHEMVRTGVDVNGLPVEIRTVEGKRITSIGDLIAYRAISHGQTVLITQQHFEPKCTPFEHAASTSAGYTTGSSSDLSQYHHGNDEELDDEEEEEEEEYEEDEGDEKVKVTRARRAERARARYHRMSQDQRREQNAKRALMLRKMRARDEQLCQLAETMPFEQIDKETAQAIREAQARRHKRAEQARSKYHRMSQDQRRRYNSNRDAQRKMRKEVEKQTYELEASSSTTADTTDTATAQPVYHYTHVTTTTTSTSDV